MRSALSLAVWALVWELVGRAQLSSIVPPLSGVVEAAFTVVPTEKFRAAALISLRTYGLGMALAVAVGIPLGIVMARSRSVGSILGLWVNIFVSAPISALVPLLMAVVGIGETTVVVTVFLFAVFVITQRIAWFRLTGTETDAAPACATTSPSPAFVRQTISIV